jgi:hypothetical protein
MEVSTTGVNLTGSPTVNSVAIANTTQLATKQDTLVSGTNIKTINGASLLGSGNIPVVTSPSGVAGAIQFSNGSAFASDAANLFWDDTNNRLGVGTNTPDGVADYGSLNLNGVSGGYLAFSRNNVLQSRIYNPASALRVETRQPIPMIFVTNNNDVMNIDTSGNATIGYNNSSLNARLGIRGSGSTSATTSLLVQDSTGQEMFRIRDNNQIDIRQGQLIFANPGANTWRVYNGGASPNVVGTTWYAGTGTFVVNDGSNVSTSSASAQLDIQSTNRGFLPPRMTTTQKNAIASPAAGLVVYDSTTNKLCCYNGSTWNDLF